MQNEQVRALRYGVVWSDQYPLTWLEGAFPASYTVSGWRLDLGESELVAEPPAPMGVDDAVEELAPVLRAWQASLEVSERLLVAFTYRGADPVPGDAGSVLAADALTAAFNATVDAKRSSPPVPRWDWVDTLATSAAREMCLRPLRRGTRPVADAAYWLATHLASWAGGGARAAGRLNVSKPYMERARAEGARSSERKVSSDMRVLTAEEKAALAKVLEELVLRLHLVESGLSPGALLTTADWPA